ncbi:beta-1,3-galactosyltransferase 5 isoform X3 [Nycticebus coucang]|uniref:beta-1,3-galactosyltransferase 5 isoform X2 n=1 Tax=Nycticebus coucang TaxID=9470 RepID=UPI00234DBB48|nr:beta-1,3-galactosyltransferase 5 isoform X2 [Nycticebus coucang]XP_053421453.1 beta-1,3-galactosyltransferase 5 isoform X3 [Nycticebus coucang]
MACSKMQWMCICFLVLGALCLYVSMYTLSPEERRGKERGKQYLVFKKDDRKFLQVPDVDCRQNPPFLVLLVTSSLGQLAARTAIRKTWGRERMVNGKPVKAFFLLGTTATEAEMRLVAQESQSYRDIIQKDFADTYYNLTLKTMMGMEWVHDFCPQASFVMKTDSDMFINVNYLVELLLKKNRTTRFFTGYLKLNEFPIRKRFNKWFISRSEYPGDKYPPFCSGTGYVLSGDVASLVFNVSRTVPYIKLEDVFVGLCLAKLGIRPQPLHWEQTFFPEGLKFSVCQFKKIVACHFVKPDDLLIYWQALESSKEGDCPAM